MPKPFRITFLRRARRLSGAEVAVFQMSESWSDAPRLAPHENWLEEHYPTLWFYGGASCGVIETNCLIITDIPAAMHFMMSEHCYHD